MYDTDPLAELDADRWDSAFAINVHAVYLAAQALLPEMNQGRVVTFSSVAAGNGGASASAGYVASKAAIEGLTRPLTLAAACSGTTVNAVSPGPVATPMLGMLDERAMSALAGRTPLGRVDIPSDIACVVRH